VAAEGPAYLRLAVLVAPQGGDAQAVSAQPAAPQPAAPQPETAQSDNDGSDTGPSDPGQAVPSDEPSQQPLPDPEVGQKDDPAPVQQQQPQATWPPAGENQPQGVHWFAWICALIVTLVMASAVLAAIWIAGHRKRFAAVGEDVEMRPFDPDAAPISLPQQAEAPQLPSAASLASAEYRRRCAASLERGGWQTQTGEADSGGPDIMAERDGTVALVRCRSASHAVTAEMVNEAVAMSAHRSGDLIILASNAPINDRARDEAAQHGVYLLRDTELAGFVA